MALCQAIRQNSMAPNGHTGRELDRRHALTVVNNSDHPAIQRATWRPQPRGKPQDQTGFGFPPTDMALVRC